MTALALPAGVAAAAGVAVAVWSVAIEPRRLVVRERELRLPRWPPELDGLRIALVSDLHAGAPHVDAERVGDVVARTNATRPDLVCLLGDFVDPNVTLGTPVAPEPVAERLGALEAPLGVVAVLGNHDWHAGGERVREALAHAGVRVLEDDAVAVGRPPRRLWLAGLADATRRDPDVLGTLAAVPEDEPLLVLSHDPDLFPHVPARAALTVSGHTHGGQVAIPGLRARVIPSRYGERYARGHVVEDGRHLYVTTGVGTSTHPIRLGAPPEIVVLRLRGPRGAG